VQRIAQTKVCGYQLNFLNIKLQIIY